MNMEEFETRLISEVESHPHLYNKTMPDYKNRIKKADSWSAISQILRRPVLDCQKKWASLRNTFSRVYKTDQHVPSGSGQIQNIKWKYFNQLKFLREYIKTPSTMSNYDVPQDSQILHEETNDHLFNEMIDISRDSVEVSLPLPSKRRRSSGGDTAEKMLEAIKSIKFPSSSPPPPPTPYLELFFVSLARQAADANLTKYEELKLQMECMRAFDNIVSRK